jgi:hypothetical protein
LSTLSGELQYVDYRYHGQSANPEPEKILKLLCEVFLEYRKDLGYKDTTCTSDDFLALILKDWKPAKM